MAGSSSPYAKLRLMGSGALQSEDILQIVGQGGNITVEIASNGGVQVSPQVLSASGAVSPHQPAWYVITDAGVAALTLAAPTATVDDGVILVFTSNTAEAHTITATGLLQTGTASVNVATFAAEAGASLTLMAYQGKWNVISSNGITFS